MQLLQKLPRQYRSTAKSFGLYWRIYGGLKGLLCSPYLLASLAISLASYPIWIYEKTTQWYSLSVSALPNLLGFTLAGYTIIIGFGDGKFRDALRGDGPNGTTSPFMILNGAFVHFLVVQILALISGIVGTSWEIKTGVIAWFGFFMLIYAIFAGLAAVMAVLNVANWFDKCPPENPPDKGPP